MNAEQLNSARLARWSQNGEARLTLEAAAEWLNAIGFCPYLPASQMAFAPAPSFLEAVVGRPAQMPSAGERSRANELLARMVENSAVVPLKLGNSLGEQPDFIASPEVLRYIYALRGDRNFKAGPSTVGNERVTPLALHCWQAIQGQGPLDVPALQPILGRDITEAAIARALQELWAGMYIFPILSATGKPAQWELLPRRFAQQIAAGASTGQAESQSAMVSLYLHAVVAAAEEEVLAFLSLLAPQSKLREVIRGLGSMRQLDMIDIAGRAHVCLQGGLLPEIVAQLSEEQLGVAMKKYDGEVGGSSNQEAGSITSGIGEDRIEIERQPQGTNADSNEARKFVPKKFVPRESGFGKSAGKRSGGQPADRPPKPSRFNSLRSEGAPRKPSTRGLGERAKRWEKTGEGVGGRGAEGGRPFERKPFKAGGARPGGFKPAAAGTGKPWESKGLRSGGEGTKPWVKRASFGAGASSAPRGRGAEERPRRWEKPGAASGYKKPYVGKPSDFKEIGAKPWARREDAGTGSQGERPKRWEGKPRNEKPFGAKSAGRKPSGFTTSGFKSAGAKAAEGRAGGGKPWVSRGAESRIGSKKSYTARVPREGENAGSKWPRKGFNQGEGAKRNFAENSEGRPKRAGKSYRPADQFGHNEGARPGKKPEDRPGGKPGDRSGKKPGPQQGAKPFWAKNPRGGKGSVAASRTNRPRGGKKGGKKK